MEDRKHATKHKHEEVFLDLAHTLIPQETVIEVYSVLCLGLYF